MILAEIKRKNAKNLDEKKMTMQEKKNEMAKEYRRKVK